MPLTIKAIAAAKPRKKGFRLADERGLYLEIPPTGSKRWRFRYRFDNKEKMLSLGTFPEISLAEARDKREHHRSSVANGIDPGAARKARKDAARKKSETFEAVSQEWFAKNKHTWTAGHSATIMARLEKNVFPWIGSIPIIELEPPDILSVLRRIESRGALETAHRVRGIIGQVFRYAVACGMAQRDQAADLKDALPPAKVTHHPSLTNPQEIAHLLRAIQDYQGHHVTRCALVLGAYTFVRPGELRHAEWSEIDIENAEWRIPAYKMKARRPHIVPLSRQAIKVLNDIHPLTGTDKYVFPSIRSTAYPMSENTINAALRRLGYDKTQMTGHGFRSMASTNLHEQGWLSDVIERQLAHVEGNSVKAAYNYAEYLPERRRMMQAWADFLDTLRDGGKITPIKHLKEA